MRRKGGGTLGIKKESKFIYSDALFWKVLLRGKQTDKATLVKHHSFPY